MVGVNIAGPNARRVIEKLTGRDYSNEVHRFMGNSVIDINGYEAIVLRVSFTGDLGFEIYVDEANQLVLYQSILKVGEEFGIRPVGSRALGSMRIEKGYGSWGREYSPEWYPTESGLAALVKTDKPEFLGREAYMKIKDLPPRQLLCNFSIDSAPGSEGADAWGGESIFRDGKYVGRITSGSYSFTFGTSVAMGYVDAPFVSPGEDYEVAILGVPHKAKMLAQPLFDPRGEKLRS
jgi:dimethylglycine dehydrogenase